jgi:hypothetical protein
MVSDLCFTFFGFHTAPEALARKGGGALSAPRRRRGGGGCTAVSL